jgi:hypothetical protein
MDVSEHERLSNFTLRHNYIKVKEKLVGSKGYRSKRT